MKWASLLGSMTPWVCGLLLFGCAERPAARGVPPESPARAAAVSPPAPGNPAYGAYPGPAEPPPLETSAPPPPRPPSRTEVDHEVAGAIHRLLNTDEFVAPGAKNVTARIRKGVVTLRGTVPSSHERDMIVQRIEQMPGVDRIDDHLTLDTPY